MVDDVFDGWVFEASRVCPACRGSGKAQPRMANDRLARFDVTECPTCDGKKRLTKSFDAERLRILLGVP